MNNSAMSMSQKMRIAIEYVKREDAKLGVKYKLGVKIQTWCKTDPSVCATTQKSSRRSHNERLSKHIKLKVR